MPILLTDEIYDKPLKKNRKLDRLESLSLIEREHKPDLKNIVLNVFLDTEAETMDTATDNGNSEISKQRLFSFVAEIHSSKKTLYIVRNIKQCGFTVFVWTTSIYLFILK
jgi:hypothetical protein